MTPLTVERAVERIRAFIQSRRKGMEGVTEGPWGVGDCDQVCAHGESDKYKEESRVCLAQVASWDGEPPEERVKPNAAFIARSRQDVPALVASLEAALKEWEKISVSRNDKRSGGTVELVGYSRMLGADALIVALATPLPLVPGEQEREKG